MSKWAIRRDMPGRVATSLGLAYAELPFGANQRSTEAVDPAEACCHLSTRPFVGLLLGCLIQWGSN